MSVQQTVPAQASPQTILVTTDYDADVADRSLCVQQAGVLVTLPDNPTVGDTTIEILAQAAYLLSGGDNPLPTDPLPVARGESFLVAFTATGWQIIGGAGGGWVTALDVLYPAEPAQTLSGSGPFLIGGFEFSKFFFGGSGENAPPQVVPGQGLIVSPANGVAEFLVVSLPNILPASALKYSTSLRLWMLMGNHNFGTSHGFFGQTAVESSSGIANFAFAAVGGAEFVDDVPNGDFAAPSAFFLNTGFGNSVIVTEIPGLDAYGSRLLGGLVSGNVFPRDSDDTFGPGGPFLLPIVSFAPPLPRAVWPIGSSPPFLAGYGLGPGVSGGTGATGTVIRFRVDYRP